MENQIHRIGVLTSGGDAPGMNAAVRAVVRTAQDCGIECVGIRRGWNGLITSDFVQLGATSVSHIIDKGGTILYTARSEEFMTEAGRDKALSTCRLLGLDGRYVLSVSATTRAPRPGERDGVNYYFMTRDEFAHKISAGEMLEYAEYVGNLYGTPRDMVREKTAQGYDVILEIEVDGARQVLKKTPDAIAIFLLPPSAEERRKFK